MLPSETFTLDSPLSPDDVLGRLQADAADWRETRLSESARTAGMYGFAFALDGHAFRLRAKMSTRGHFVPVYDGIVLPTKTGSRIDGAFRIGRPTLAFLALWVCGATLTFVFTIGRLAGSAGVVGALVVLAALLGLVGVCTLWTLIILRYAWRQRDLARDETQALLIRASAAGPSPKSRLTSRLSGPA